MKDLFAAGTLVALTISVAHPALASTPEGRQSVTSVTGGKYTMNDWEQYPVPTNYAPRSRACLDRVRKMYEARRARGSRDR